MYYKTVFVTVNNKRYEVKVPCMPNTPREQLELSALKIVERQIKDEQKKEFEYKLAKYFG